MTGNITEIFPGCKVTRSSGSDGGFLCALYLPGPHSGAWRNHPGLDQEGNYFGGGIKKSSLYSATDNDHEEISVPIEVFPLSS